MEEEVLLQRLGYRTLLTCGRWSRKAAHVKLLAKRSPWFSKLVEEGKFCASHLGRLDDEGRAVVDVFFPMIETEDEWKTCTRILSPSGKFLSKNAFGQFRRNWRVVFEFLDFIDYSVVGPEDVPRSEITATKRVKLLGSREVFVKIFKTAFELVHLFEFPTEDLLALASEEDDPTLGSDDLLDSIGRSCRTDGVERKYVALPNEWKEALPELSPRATLRLWSLWARVMKRKLGYARGWWWSKECYVDVFEERELVKKLKASAAPGRRLSLDKTSFVRGLWSLSKHPWLSRMGAPSPAWWPEGSFVAGSCVTGAACGLGDPDATEEELEPWDERDLDVWTWEAGLFEDTESLSSEGCSASYYWNVQLETPGTDVRYSGPPKFMELARGIRECSGSIVASARFGIEDYARVGALAETTLSFVKPGTPNLQILQPRSREKEPADVVERFDLDCVRAWYDPAKGKLHAHVGALLSWITGTTGWKREVAREDRFLKYAARGFRPEGYSSELVSRLMRVDAEIQNLLFAGLGLVDHPKKFRPTYHMPDQFISPARVATVELGNVESEAAFERLLNNVDRLYPPGFSSRLRGQPKAWAVPAIVLRLYFENLRVRSIFKADDGKERLILSAKNPRDVDWLSEIFGRYEGALNWHIPGQFSDGLLSPVPFKSPETDLFEVDFDPSFLMPRDATTCTGCAFLTTRAGKKKAKLRLKLRAASFSGQATGPLTLTHVEDQDGKPYVVRRHFASDEEFIEDENHLREMDRKRKRDEEEEEEED